MVEQILDLHGRFWLSGSFGHVTSAIVCAASSFSMSVTDSGAVPKGHRRGVLPEV
jgi:hypothetical protein